MITVKGTNREDKPSLIVGITLEELLELQNGLTLPVDLSAIKIDLQLYIFAANNDDDLLDAMRPVMDETTHLQDLR